MGDLTDRELLLLTKQKVENMEDKFTEAVNHLSESIKRLGDTMKELDVIRIQKMEQRVEKVEATFLQIKGGWRAVLIISAVISAAIGYAIKYFSH